MEDLMQRSIRRENAQPKLLLHEKQRQQLRLQQRRLSQCDEVLDETDSNESCKGAGDQINLDDYLSSLSGHTLPSSTISHNVSMSQSWSPAASTGIKRNPPPTLKEEDEENSWPGSPTSEELPKWLQEARDLKLKKKKERSSGRSLGSNYLDSYLGNLTHHSWLNYAPSTPTTQQNLYMPKRVFLYPDAYYNRKKTHKQQLFMSRSFTEGISDATLSGITESKRHKGTPCSDEMNDLTTHSYSEQRDFSSDSPGTDKSTSISKDTIEEESFEPPSMNATESGMDTDDLHQTSGVHTSSGSACFSPKSIRVTSVTVTCDAENSIAVDSLEADVPIVTTETSGVVTHETDEVKDKYELTEDEVTISENFPDIPFEHEYSCKADKSVITTVVADEITNDSVEEKSVSNASDESSSCTQQSTIQIIDCNVGEDKTSDDKDTAVKSVDTEEPQPTENPLNSTRSVSFASIASPVLSPEDVSCSFSDMFVSDKNDRNDSTKSVIDSNSICDISLDSVSEPLQENNNAAGCDTESGKSSSSCETVCHPQTIETVTVLSGERSPATAISSSVVSRVLERKVSLTSITSSVTQSPIDSNSLTSSHIQSSSGISSCSPITPIKPPTSLQHAYPPNFMPLSFPNISSNYGFPSKSATPISSPHRHSTPTTPSSHFGLVSVGQKCSSKQHHINALLQLLRVQHHHEREQLVAKQQEEMQQFLQHLQKLTPSQLQHIVSSQVTSVQSNKISNRGTPSDTENKPCIAESASPCDDNYSVSNSQSTPSHSDSKSTPSGNVMPSFYLHNPSNAPTAGKVTTPGHINKLFLSFPSKKKCQSPSQPETPHKATTPNLPKGYTSYTVMGGQSSISSLDLTRQRHSFSRSQSDTIGTNLLQSKDSCISLPPDIINNIPHTPSTPFISKPSKQAFNEKQVISNSTRNLKNKYNATHTSSGNLLHPLTPREDMADLSSSLTNSDIFNSLQGSLIMESDDKNYSKKKKFTKETPKQNLRPKESAKTSATEVFMQGLIKLQALARGDHIRQLLNCQTVQQHIQTLSEVNKLAEQFHKDIMSDNIKKADVDFHRALYHQEECARKEFYRLFIVASYAEQRKVINRDKVVKVATAKRTALAKRSPSTSRQHSAVQSQSSSRRNIPGSKSNEFLSARINSEEARSPRSRNKIPVLSGKNTNNKANTSDRPIAAPRVTKQPTIYKHVQSRYLSNLAKKTNYSKAMETSKNSRSHYHSSSRIALPNCSASPVLSASTRRLNEKMCRSAHQTTTSQTKHSPPDWQQRAGGRGRGSYQTSFASGSSKHQPHRSTVPHKKYCTTISNVGTTAAGDGDRKVSREQLWR